MTGPARPSVPVVPVGREAAGAPAAALYDCVITHSRITPLRHGLDPTLTYSSAVFTAFPARPAALLEAQHRKIDRLLDLAQVGDGTRLLEIGTGWGELALRAAARGARVTTLTLSAEQAALARERIAAAGLADRVDVQLRDYRQMLRTDAAHTFISKYVFPGGLIPSRETIAEHSADDGYGAHYAETLRLWRERFTAHRSVVTGLGFDTVFQRMREFYLAYSEAGFRSGYLDVRQLLLTEGTRP